MLLYTCNHVMHGFSARLSSQLFKIEKFLAHLDKYKGSFGKLYTTHTSKFLGLKCSLGIWHASSYKKDVIIGENLHGSEAPELKLQFLDRGMMLMPKKWKGK